MGHPSWAGPTAPHLSSVRAGEAPSGMAFAYSGTVLRLTIWTLEVSTAEPPSTRSFHWIPSWNQGLSDGVGKGRGANSEAWLCYCLI